MATRSRPLARVRGGDRDVVEQAEAHRAVPLGMMAGRPDHRERARTVTLERAIDARDRRAGREQRDLVGIGRGEGVEVERGGAPGGLRHERDVLAIVHARELVVRRGTTRLAHVATALAELGRDDLHDLRALETLGMPGRVEMVGETIGREDGQTHIWPEDVLHFRSVGFSRRSSRAPGFSSAARRRSSSCRADSIWSSVASRGTSSGSPIASATVLNGFGICVRSQLLIVQCDEASR